jgi:excisionase family DNA binding protein
MRGGVMSEVQVLPKVEEAAEALRIGRTMMFQLIGSGEIPSILIGRSRRISVDAIRESAKKLETATAA